MFCTLNLENFNVYTLNYRRKLSINYHTQLFPVFQFLSGFLSAVDSISIRQESCQSVNCQQHLWRVQRKRYEIVAYHFMLMTSVYKYHIPGVKDRSPKVQKMSMSGITKKNYGFNCLIKITNIVILQVVEWAPRFSGVITIGDNRCRPRPCSGAV